MVSKPISSRVARTFRREERPATTDPKPFLDANLRGLLVLAGAMAALVAIAYGAMIALTGPDGWMARAAQAAITETEPAVLTFWAEPGAR